MGHRAHRRTWPVIHIPVLACLVALAGCGNDSTLDQREDRPRAAEQEGPRSPAPARTEMQATDDEPSAAARQAAQSDARYDKKTPRYLPPGVSEAGRSARGVFYEITGEANAAAPGRPSTTVQLSSVAGDRPRSPVAGSPVFDVQPVQAGAFRGLLTTPRNGYGTVRFDVTDGSDTYTLLSHWQQTEFGKSGLPLQDLQRMVESLA